MMRRSGFPLYIFSAALLMGAAQSGHTETIAVSVGTQGDNSVQLPGRAWTQSKVEENFGTPLNRQGPVGEPPITTWRYDQFSVYFEHDRVIHTVRNYREAD